MSSVQLVIVFLLILVTSICSKGPPRYVASRISLRQSVSSGESLRLVCPVDSDPPAYVEWEKDGEVIHVGWERYRVRSQDSALVIRDMERADSGVYRCTAVNGFGSFNYQYNVVVTPAAGSNDSLAPARESDETSFKAPTFPRLRQMLEYQEVTQAAGSTVSLRCRASGLPKPSVVWFKDGRPLQLATGAGVDLDDDDGNNGGLPGGGGPGGTPAGGWTLRLIGVSARDNGRYMCRVTNVAGTINFTYILNINDHPSSLPEFIEPHLTNVTVAYLDKAVFHCHVRSEMQPIIQWLKHVDSGETAGNSAAAAAAGVITVANKTYVVLSGPFNGVMLTRPDGSYLSRLTIYNVTQQHAGLYICSATNTRGFSYRGAYLTVHVPGVKDNSHLRGSSSSGVNGTFAIPLIIALAIATSIFVGIILIVIAFSRCRRSRHASVVDNKPSNGGGYMSPPGAAAAAVSRQQQLQRQKLAPLIVAPRSESTQHFAASRFAGVERLAPAGCDVNSRGCDVGVYGEAPLLDNRLMHTCVHYDVRRPDRLRAGCNQRSCSLN